MLRPMVTWQQPDRSICPLLPLLFSYFCPLAPSFSTFPYPLCPQGHGRPTINALKPWTASSHRDPPYWSNGAGLPLKTHKSNLPLGGLFAFPTTVITKPSNLSEQAKVSCPCGNQPELSSCPFSFGLGCSPSSFEAFSSSRSPS